MYERTCVIREVSTYVRTYVRTNAGKARHMCARTNVRLSGVREGMLGIEGGQRVRHPPQSRQVLRLHVQRMLVDQAMDPLRNLVDKRFAAHVPMQLLIEVDNVPQLLDERLGMLDGEKRRQQSPANACAPRGEPQQLLRHTQSIGKQTRAHGPRKSQTYVSTGVRRQTRATSVGISLERRARPLDKQSYLRTYGEFRTRSCASRSCNTRGPVGPWPTWR